MNTHIQNRTPVSQMTDEQRRAMFARLRAAGIITPSMRDPSSPLFDTHDYLSTSEGLAEVSTSIASLVPPSLTEISPTIAAITTPDRSAPSRNPTPQPFPSVILPAYYHDDIDNQIEAATRRSLDQSAPATERLSASQTAYDLQTQRLIGTPETRIVSGAAHTIADLVDVAAALADFVNPSEVSDSDADFGTYDSALSNLGPKLRAWFPDVDGNNFGASIAEGTGRILPVSGGPIRQGATWLYSHLGDIGKALAHWLTPLSAAGTSWGLKKITDSNPTMNPEAEKYLSIASQLSAYVATISGLGAAKSQAAGILDKIEFPVSRQSFREHYLDLESRVLASEKSEIAEPLTAIQRYALEHGTPEQFSRLRGYTPEQIADHTTLLELNSLPNLQPTRLVQYPKGSPNEGQLAQSVEPDDVFDAWKPTVSAKDSISDFLSARGAELSSAAARVTAHVPAPIKSTLSGASELHARFSHITGATWEAIINLPKLKSSIQKSRALRSRANDIATKEIPRLRADSRESLDLALLDQIQATTIRDALAPSARAVETQIDEVLSYADDIDELLKRRSAPSRRDAAAVRAQGESIANAADEALTTAARIADEMRGQADSIEDFARIRRNAIHDREAQDLLLSHQMSLLGIENASDLYRTSSDAWYETEAAFLQSRALAKSMRQEADALTARTREAYDRSRQNATAMTSTADDLENAANIDDAELIQAAATLRSNATFLRDFLQSGPEETSRLIALIEDGANKEILRSAARHRGIEELSAQRARLLAAADDIDTRTREQLLFSALVTTGFGAKLAAEELSISDIEDEMFDLYSRGESFTQPPETPRSQLQTIAAFAVGTTGNPLEKQFRYGEDLHRASVANYRVKHRLITEARQNGILTQEQADKMLRELSEKEKPWNMAGKSAWTFAPASASFLSWTASRIADQMERTEIDRRVPGSYIDGDTLSTENHRGANSIRILDLNAPELPHANIHDPDHPERTTGEYLGPEAAARAAELVRDGQYVRVVADSHPRAAGRASGSDRLVRQIETLPQPFDNLLRIPVIGELIPAQDFTEQMILSGLGDIHYRGLSGPTDKSKLHDEARAIAQKAGVNIWSPEGRAKLPWVGTEKTTPKTRKERIAEKRDALDAFIVDAQTPLGAGLMYAGNLHVFASMNNPASPDDAFRASAAGDTIARLYNATVAAFGAAEFNIRAKENQRPFVFSPPAGIPTQGTTIFDKELDQLTAKTRAPSTNTPPRRDFIKELDSIAAPPAAKPRR